MGKDLIVLGGLLVASYFIFGKPKTEKKEENLRTLNGGLNASCNVCQSTTNGENYLSVRGMCRTGDNCISTQKSNFSLLQ